MKTILPFFLVWLVLAGGCMSDDLSDCPSDDNLFLYFSYKGTDGTDRFDESVRSVDTYVFDNDYRLVTHTHVDRQDLDRFRGVRFQLPEETYHIVCWANSGEGTIISRDATNYRMEDYQVEFIPSGGGDPLYYGFHTVAYQKGTVQYADTVSFVRAHRTLHIYVEGLEDLKGNSPRFPVGSITNSPAGYDFHMAFPENLFTGLESTAGWMEEDKAGVALSRIYLPLFTEVDGMEVQLFRSTGEMAADALLETYLMENPPEDDYDIHIRFGFMESGIEITLPGWSSSGGGLTPEFKYNKPSKLISHE